MLSANNQVKLHKIVQEHGFEHALDYLKKTVRQGIRLSKQELESYEQVGNSRIGGDPDLPADMEWPIDEDGTPMTFLAQLRLSEIAVHDESSLLPKDGMLLFFVGIDEPAYHIEHKVLFLTEEQLHSATHRLSPEDTTLEDDFTGYQVMGRASIEPPNYGYSDSEQLEDDEHDYDQYEELTFDLTDNNSGDLAVMFGYPATQHGDCEYEAALALLTGEEYNYSESKALERITVHMNGDQTKAEQEVRDTLLLLALDSDRDVGFCWWDAGELQFYIRKEDLLAGNFTRTYCSLYSS
ncbi:YwqG family protein [Paenibacillus sp. NPDC057967]|uniref:YwqG family protein n=1 Tax=Paenibacillus sp. NPDC057967 TaxID=3346293 RepID=UPI0036DCA73E